MMRQLNLDFWATVMAVLAALMLALGAVMWFSGSPPTKGISWLCGPSSAWCLAIGIMNRKKHPRLANLYLLMAAVWLVTDVLARLG